MPRQSCWVWRWCSLPTWAGIGGSTIAPQGAAKAWQRFHAAVNQQNLPELDDLAEQFPSDQIGQWSALQAADIRLLQGSQAMFTHRATAVQDLDRAVDEYTQVIERSREPQFASAHYSVVPGPTNPWPDRGRAKDSWTRRSPTIS